MLKWLNEHEYYKVKLQNQVKIFVEEWRLVQEGLNLKSTKKQRTERCPQIFSRIVYQPSRVKSNKCFLWDVKPCVIWQLFSFTYFPWLTGKWEHASLSHRGQSRLHLGSWKCFHEHVHIAVFFFFIIIFHIFLTINVFWLNKVKF